MPMGLVILALAFARCFDDQKCKVPNALNVAAVRVSYSSPGSNVYGVLIILLIPLYHDMALLSLSRCPFQISATGMCILLLIPAAN